MSDFTSSFWSIFIIVITLGGIAGCVWLLWVNMTRKQAGPAQTMGHVWDEDLAELNNPLPMWWAWLFVITVVFSLVYLTLYPGLGSFKGLWNWSSAGAWQGEQKDAALKYDALYAKYATVAVPQLAADPRANAIGERLFLNNCAQCHSSDGKGSRGFPNLVDRDWLWGGEPARIEETLLHGRRNQMPPMGEVLGGPQAVDDMAHYVLSLSGSVHDSAKAARAKDKFAICAACHAAGGSGNPAMGAPNLTDRIWLHGGTLARIRDTISHGRQNEMPNFGERLGPEKVHLLTAYVWSLSHGKQAVLADAAPAAVAVSASPAVAVAAKP